MAVRDPLGPDLHPSFGMGTRQPLKFAGNLRDGFTTVDSSVTVFSCCLRWLIVASIRWASWQAKAVRHVICIASSGGAIDSDRGALDPQPPPSGGFPRFRSGKGSVSNELRRCPIIRPPQKLPPLTSLPHGRASPTPDRPETSRAIGHRPGPRTREMPS